MTETQDASDRWERLLRIAAWGGAAFLFLLPLAAEQLTAEMAWTAFDFMMWGGMLTVALIGFETAMRLSKNWWYRFGAAVAIGSAFLLFWVTGAVGVIGSEAEPSNRLYLGVIALVIGGAFGAGARPQGMARALVAAAVAQAAVGALALANGWGAGAEPNWFAAIVGATCVFTGAWLLSAWLFRRAARSQAS
jgi:hypothetical protein